MAPAVCTRRSATATMGPVGWGTEAKRELRYRGGLGSMRPVLWCGALGAVPRRLAQWPVVVFCTGGLSCKG